MKVDGLKIASMEKVCFLLLKKTPIHKAGAFTRKFNVNGIRTRLRMKRLEHYTIKDKSG